MRICVEVQDRGLVKQTNSASTGHYIYLRECVVERRARGYVWSGSRGQLESQKWNSGFRSV